MITVKRTEENTKRILDLPNGEVFSGIIPEAGGGDPNKVRTFLKSQVGPREFVIFCLDNNEGLSNRWCKITPTIDVIKFKPVNITITIED